MKRKLTILLLFLASFSFAQSGFLFVDGGLVYNEGFQNYLPYPNENLTAVFDTAYINSNGDLLNMARGANATYVSGTGLDKIYDFSGLNDDRLNKNAYLGNSSGLDEYYNYPYDSIYFDTSNPYYWKLKDFHRYYLEDQILDETLNDCFFLKASATSNTSNVLDEVSGLVVYSTPLADSNLSKTLSWIGIQADFYELYDTPNLFIDDNWTTSNATINSNTSFTINSTNGLIVKSNFWVFDYKIGDIFRFNIMANLDLGNLTIRSSSSIYTDQPNVPLDTQLEVEIISYFESANQVLQIIGDAPATINFYDFYIEKKYVNYYKQ